VRRFVSPRCRQRVRIVGPYLQAGRSRPSHGESFDECRRSAGPGFLTLADQIVMIAIIKLPMRSELVLELAAAGYARRSR